MSSSRLDILDPIHNLSAGSQTLTTRQLVVKTSALEKKMYIYSSKNVLCNIFFAIFLVPKYMYIYTRYSGHRYSTATFAQLEIRQRGASVCLQQASCVLAMDPERAIKEGKPEVTTTPPRPTGVHCQMMLYVLLHMFFGILLYRILNQ